MALTKEDLETEVLTRIAQVTAAREHPAFFMHHVKCVDSRSGEVFEFEVLNEDEARKIGVKSRAKWLEESERETAIGKKDWSWQRDYLEWILENDLTCTLKGRQLGVTWVWAALALWYLLFKPGVDVLIYSIKEEDAAEVVNRIWDMWLSLPPHFKSLVKVLKPSRGARPTTRIEYEHPDGRVSTITGMPATASAGHSRSAALIIFDEASRQDHARALWKAVVPATADKGGKIGVVSTANGMSDPTTKLGNFFHELYSMAGTVVYPKLKTRFLGWWLHPLRDVKWREELDLDPPSKAEQYPDSPEEAFLMSGSPFFDTDSLVWYAKNALLTPLFQGEFIPDASGSRATFEKREGGAISIFELPDPGRKYAAFTDCSTGTGLDFSVIAVIDLATMSPVAEYRGKGDYDKVAEQAHFLGRFYNEARLAVENQGGYGSTVIAYLRDGKNGRPPYRMLYRYKHIARQDTVKSHEYGFPMNSKTRPLVISEMKKALRERALPGITQALLTESRTFVNRDTRPSPRAADGCNDDAVMAWCGVLELYREFGEHERDIRKSRRRTKYKPRRV